MAARQNHHVINTLGPFDGYGWVAMCVVWWLIGYHTCHEVPVSIPTGAA